MSNDRKAHWLSLFLKVYGIGCILLFSTLFLAFSMRLSVIDHGGLLNWAIWDDVRDHVGPMLFAIYIVWGIFLFRASRDLKNNASFLDFTIWANLAHGVLMVFQTTASHHDFLKIFTDVPWILAAPLVIGGLRSAYSSSGYAEDLGRPAGVGKASPTAL